MANFLVVRHGEDAPRSKNLPVAYGSIDTPLTPTGYSQAERAAEVLARHDVVAVHAPPLARTLGTAERICGIIGSRLVPDETLLGRDMGPFALGGHRAMAKAATETYRNSQGVPYYMRVPGAEPLDALYDRLQIAYAALTEQYADSDGSVAMVTQHFAGTLLRGAHDRLTLTDAIDYGDLGHAAIALLAPGEFSIELQPVLPVQA